MQEETEVKMMIRDIKKAIEERPTQPIAVNDNKGANPFNILQS